MASTIYESEPVAVFSAINSFAYPSANSQNQGQLNSEENIKWIMLRLTKRTFTLTPDDFKLSKKNTENTIFTISNGDANIEGYHFRCTQTTEIDITDEKFYTAELEQLLVNATSESTAIKLYIKFKKNVDASGHLLTYSTDTSTQTISNFEGFEIILTSATPYADEFYLGYVSVYKNQGNVTISEVVNNPYKCMFINSTNIYADDDNLGNEERTLNNLIKYLINSILGGGLDSDIICYGPDTGNRDGTSNIFISNKKLYLLSTKNPNASGVTAEEKKAIEDAKKNMNYIRIYYNPMERKGGIQLVKGLDVRDQEDVSTTDSPPDRVNLLAFDLNTEGDKSPIIELFPMFMTFGKKDGKLTVLGSLEVNQNVNVIGNYISANGSIKLGDTDTKTLGQGNIEAKIITGEKVYGAVWS